MDGSTIGLAKVLVPKAPLLFKTALFNSLSLSENSKKQDVRTETTVAIIRSLLTGHTSISKLQKGSQRDPGVKGPMWISTATIPASQDEPGPVEALQTAIKELGDSTETYTSPEVAELQGEWTGYRRDAKGNTLPPPISELAKYNEMMEEVESDLTVLYFHGGAMM